MTNYERVREDFSVKELAIIILRARWNAEHLEPKNPVKMRAYRALMSAADHLHCQKIKTLYIKELFCKSKIPAETVVTQELDVNYDSQP